MSYAGYLEKYITYQMKKNTPIKNNLKKATMLTLIF